MEQAGKTNGISCLLFSIGSFHNFVIFRLHVTNNKWIAAEGT
jgi:hypothetical protein